MNTARLKKELKFLCSYLVKIIIGIIVISPLLFAFSSSLMPTVEIQAKPPRFIPSVPTIENYITVLKKFPIATYFKNTLIVCTIEVLAQVFICSFAAYGFSFFKFKGKKLLFYAVLATMMIPAETTVVSNYLTIQQARLVNTYAGLVLPSLVGGMGIFLMRQYFLTVPKELKEAATIDGCGDYRFFYRVLMPISVSNLVSLSIYVFVLSYNRYFWPLLVTNKDKMRTIQIGASYLKSFDNIDYGLILAGAVVFLVPAILVFIIGMKYLVRGMTAGAVKG